MGFFEEHFSEPRRKIIHVIKRKGSSSTSELASLLDITGEAVRQHLLQLVKDGWISSYSEKSNGMGRPTLRYRLTRAGEHLFDKKYDHLSIEVLDKVVQQFGEKALKQVLSAMIEERIREWRPRLMGLNLMERLEVLKNLYLKEDPYMELVQQGNSIYLIERNCPFQNVAMQRPMLCSVTVSVLTHLLGCTVKREQRFQNGDGCCAFRIFLHEPVDENTPHLIMEH